MYIQNDWLLNISLVLKIWSEIGFILCKFKINICSPSILFFIFKVVLVTQALYRKWSTPFRCIKKKCSTRIEKLKPYFLKFEGTKH